MGNSSRWRYIELWAPVKLMIYSESALILTNLWCHISCHYHNLLKMLCFKWISQKFGWCQMLKYIAKSITRGLWTGADNITIFLTNDNFKFVGDTRNFEGHYLFINLISNSNFHKTLRWENSLFVYRIVNEGRILT